MIRRTRSAWLTGFVILLISPLGLRADDRRDPPRVRPEAKRGGRAGVASRSDRAPLTQNQRVRVVDLRRLGERTAGAQDPPAEMPDGWLDFDVEQTPYPRVLVRDGRYGWSDYRGRPHLLRRYVPYGYYGGFDALGAQRALEEAYYAGRLDERQYRQRSFNRRDMARRKARLLDKHEQALQAGLAKLKAGDYARAVIGLSMAAELNEGDPACRIHLAQARLAMGHYPEAARNLRRALQLQPKLVYVDLNLDKYYPRAGTLARYADALTTWLGQNRAEAELYFLLGFLEFQRGRFDQAHAAFGKAARGMPNDRLTRAYRAIAKPPTD